MNTRREFVSGLLLLWVGAAGAGAAAKSGPIEVTYYFLPG
jgi:hypothetical protein